MTRRSRDAGGHSAADGPALFAIVVSDGDADGAAHVDRCLESLRACPQLDPDRHVQVVATTGIEAALRELPDASRVLLLSDRCTVTPDAVEALHGRLVGAPGVGVVSADLVDEDGQRISTARRELTLRSVFWVYTSTGRRLDARLRRDAGLRRRTYAGPRDGVTEVDAVTRDCVVTWSALARGRGIAGRLGDPLGDEVMCRLLRDDGYRCEVVASARGVLVAAAPPIDAAADRAATLAAMRTLTLGRFGVWRSAALWVLLVLDAVLAAVLSAVRVGPGRRRLREEARGTWGALGGPGGARPPGVAAMRPRPRVLLRRLGNAFPQSLRRGSRRLRRRVFVLRLRFNAWLVRSALTVDVHPTADIGRHVQIEMLRRRRVTVVIGPDTKLQPHVHLRLGGDLRIGPRCELRSLVHLHVQGRLELAGRNVLGRGTVAHAGGDQVWEFGASTAEYAGVADSEHLLDGSPLMAWSLPVAVRPIRIGAGALLAAHSFVTAGCHVGAGAIVGANAVVTDDIPAAVIAVGAPARVVRRLPYGRSPGLTGDEA